MLIKENNKINQYIGSHDDGTFKIIYADIDTAKNNNASHLVFEGDYGGQIYAVIPLDKIQCDFSILVRLLEDLNDKYWKEIEGADMYFCTEKEGSTIPGGMGGGVAESDLWVHSELEDIKENIRAVISGKKDSLE